MEDLHRVADKLFTEAVHLDHLLSDDMSENQIDVALSVAKRVRRHSTILVQQLAALRDKLHPQEGTSK